MRWRKRQTLVAGGHVSGNIAISPAESGVFDAADRWHQSSAYESNRQDANGLLALEGADGVHIRRVGLLTLTVRPVCADAPAMRTQPYASFEIDEW